MAGTKKSSTKGRSKSPAKKDSKDTKKAKPLSERFKPGDIVWTKMKGYPWWPAVVSFLSFLVVNR